MSKNKASKPSESEPRNVSITIDADGFLTVTNWTLGFDGQQERKDETWEALKKGLESRGVTLSAFCPIGQERRLCG